MNSLEEQTAEVLKKMREAKSHSSNGHSVEISKALFIEISLLLIALATAEKAEAKDD